MKTIIKLIKPCTLKCVWLFFISLSLLNCQSPVSESRLSIDLTNQLKFDQEFNGTILVNIDHGKEIHVIHKGFADLSLNTPLNSKHQFIIGSISKQITAVMILLAYENGKLNLLDPISHHLINFKPNWGDSITIHHLLTHKHGIKSLNKPLSFNPGTEFDYSQLGYQLLANILEAIEDTTFEAISTQFFKKHGLKNTCHPLHKNSLTLAKGYTQQNNDSIILNANSFENYVPAGTFISSAEDMVKWNNLLHSGQLVSDSTFNLMCTKYATRNHPIFGKIDYGYGLTFKANENNIQIGALGFAPGYVSSNFYFPKIKTSIIIFENVARSLDDFKKTFQNHLMVITYLRNKHDLVK